MLTKQAEIKLDTHYADKASNGYEIFYWPTHGVKLRVAKPFDSDGLEAVATFNIADAEALILGIREAVRVSEELEHQTDGRH